MQQCPLFGRFRVAGLRLSPWHAAGDIRLVIVRQCGGHGVGCPYTLFDVEALIFRIAFQDFLRNNRGINDGGDLPAEFMEDIYNRIVNNEIKMKV